ncbi:MAG: PDZ domain-containing protein [Candidatus Delongbacteria bacterium]|nr:PDZ domain-containing protein [Candidatus Delongbacteria bacterium]MBN2834254.1 PDZ domain-containing protein [Candidatus Delongbacteria bacterium]
MTTKLIGKTKLILVLILVFLSFFEYLTASELKRNGEFGIAYDRLEGGEGVLITYVKENSSADISGIKTNDIITKINNVKITSKESITDLIKKSKFKAGDKINLEIIRENKVLNTELNFIEKPRESHPDFDIIYDFVEVNNSKLRMIITKPKGNEKYPALFFIPGFNAVSIDYPTASKSKNPYKELLYYYTLNGYVTCRVEKFGMGDSDLPLAEDVDFDSEVLGFKKGLQKLKQFDFVDNDRLFIFGHSMGGVIAPEISENENIKAIAVFGTLGRTWFEYSIENTRNQVTLRSDDYKAIEEYCRYNFNFASKFYIDKLTPKELIEKDSQ